MTYKPSEQGHTDLVSGLSSEFISRSMYTALQVSMLSTVSCCISVYTSAIYNTVIIS